MEKEANAKSIPNKWLRRAPSVKNDFPLLEYNDDNKSRGMHMLTWLDPTP